MAVTLAEGLGQRHKTPSYELVMRAMREFDALPTLRLSLEQTMRLLDLDRHTCEDVLEALQEVHLINRDDQGRYHRADVD